MRKTRVKALRAQFEKWFGSSDRTSETYKYHWRLLKKSVSRKNWKQIPKRVVV